MTDAVQEREAAAVHARQASRDCGEVGARVRFNAVRQPRPYVSPFQAVAVFSARGDEVGQLFRQLPWQAQTEKAVRR